MHLYFWTVFLLFWLPGIALTILAWRRLSRPARSSFWTTCAIMTVVSGLMEYVYLKADIWNFYEANDPLFGLRIMGAPVEEFVYWFGATPFVLSVYFLLCRWTGSLRRPVALPRGSSRPA